MKKRILSAILLLACIWTLICPVFADETTAAVETTAPETAAKPEPAEEPEEEIQLTVELENVNAACMYNIENDRYIYELDADKVIHPASTVKLMTAILAFEAFGDDLSHVVSVTAPAIINLQGNKLGLKYAEELTVEELLYAMLVGNYNDAANVLAIEIAGTVEDFVVLMNKKAEELGAVNTYYTNPTGMHDPRMVTTARDTVIISTHACKIPTLMEITSVEKYVLAPTNKTGTRTFYNKNYYYATNMEYLYIWKIPRGLNAGYTDEGGYCVATTASRNGLTYVVVVMGATRDEKYIYSYTEAADLIKWALNTYGYTKLLTTSDMICEVPVRLASKVDYVTLFPSENIELFLPKGRDLENDVKLEWTLDQEYFTAPVSEGQVGGKLTLTYDGVNLGTFDLITRNSVNRNNILYVLDLLAAFFSGSWVRVAVIIALIALAGYIGVLVMMRIRLNRLRAQAKARTRGRMQAHVSTNERPAAPGTNPGGRRDL